MATSASHAPAALPPFRAWLIGLVVNITLGLGKLFAGVFGHSYALIADALESLVDVAASLVVLGGIRVAARPPDDTHPYGHGKAEAIAAMVVAIMLFIAGIGIAVQAIRSLVAPHGGPAPFTLAVLVGVIIAKEVIFRIQRGAAKHSESSAMLADAWHNRSDAITSAAAGIGITIALIGGPAYHAADAWGALAASAIVLYNAWRLLLTPLHELMDAAPLALVEQVRATAAEVDGVAQVEKTFARKIGPQYLVDMHLHVSPSMSVLDAHNLSGKVKSAVRAAHPSVRNVLIHVEPADEDGAAVPDGRAGTLSAMRFRTLFLLLPLVLAGCAKDPPRDPVAGALTSEDPPADFVLGLTVVAPAPTASTPRGAVPARYLVQPDWLLRASTSGPTERLFPMQTRQLSHDEARRLWWDLRDSGLLDASRPTDFATQPPPPPAGTPPVYIVSTTVAGRTRRLVLGAADATSTDAGAARRLADRLAALAWVEQ